MYKTEAAMSKYKKGVLAVLVLLTGCQTRVLPYFHGRFKNDLNC